MSRKMPGTVSTAEAKPSLVPKLRFPEFRGATGWKQAPLKQFLHYLQPTPYLVADANYSPAFKTPVLTAGKTFVLGYTDEQHGIFTEGLPVIIFDDFTTATQFVDFPFKAKSSAMKILQAKDGADIKFMYEMLQTVSFEVGAHERHWISNFAPMLITAPKPAEQQKIADCLSSLDELIAAQARKVGALKTHKKGLMQQLFPCEGEAQPQLRFPNFRGTLGWEMTTLGDLAKLVRGPFGGSLKKEMFVATGYAVYEQQHAIRANFDLFRYHITLEKFEELRRFAIAANDIIMSCSGTMGKFAVVPTGAVAGVINQALLKLSPTGRCNAIFLKHLLELPSVQEKLLSQSAGGAIQNVVSVDQIKALLLPLPGTAEQEALIACVSSIDTLITTAIQELDALKTHKKGLMQQLFPSAEAEAA